MNTDDTAYKFITDWLFEEYDTAKSVIIVSNPVEFSQVYMYLYYNNRLLYFKSFNKISLDYPVGLVITKYEDNRLYLARLESKNGKESYIRNYFKEVMEYEDIVVRFFNKSLIINDIGVEIERGFDDIINELF